MVQGGACLGYRQPLSQGATGQPGAAGQDQARSREPCRSLLKNLGLLIDRAKFNVFAVRAEELIEGRPELIAAIRPVLEARNAVEQQVSELDWTSRISKCGDAMLQSYLFEAAGVLPTRVPKWSALKALGIKLAKRSGLRKATVAVARKLAVTAWGSMEPSSTGLRRRLLPGEGIAEFVPNGGKKTSNRDDGDGEFDRFFARV